MNWGIIGHGEIAPAFIRGLSFVEGQTLHAIASRSGHRQLTAENRYPGVRIYSTYEDLLDDPLVEIVYICTTNNLHKANVLAALDAGKHVLAEKPLGVCREDAVEMVREATRRGRFLMEGMWTRFLPAYRFFKELLTGSPGIGSVNFVRIDFGFLSTWGEERRLKNKELFGGTILDNGDYNIFLCQDIFSQVPNKLSAFGRVIDTSVEDICGVMLQYPSGAIAQLFSGFEQSTEQEAMIYGSRGWIRLKEFWHGTEVEWQDITGKHGRHFPFRGNGFEYEIEEVCACIAGGRIECPVITHAMTLETAEIMDRIIEQLKQAT